MGLNTKILNSCNIYILLWMAGKVQNMFLESSLVSMAFYIPYLAMTLYYLLNAILFYRPKGVTKALLVFFLVLSFYGIVLLIQNDVKGVEGNSFLLMLFSSLAPVFVFYVFARQGQLTEQKMMFFFFVFLLFAFLNFYTYKTTHLYLQSKKYDATTNNTTYFFVGLIPFVFLFKNKRFLQYIILAVIMYFVVTGLKKGAMISASVLLFYFIYKSVKQEKGLRKFLTLFLTTILLVAGVLVVFSYYENSAFFQHRIEEAREIGLGARSTIYSTLWKHYYTNDNFFQLIFGEGAYHTKNITRYYMAHSDWLELLIDCGMFGVLLYLVYWISFLSDCRRLRYDVENEMVYNIMGACLIFTFAKTFFSMSFAALPFCSAMIMGYCFGYTDSRKVQISLVDYYHSINNKQSSI